MRRTLALLVLSVTVLAGCGGSDDPDSAPSADGSGSGDEVVTAPADICGAVPADQVGAAMGVDVTAEEVPGGGCSYEQDDPRATSVSVSTVPTTSENGGFEAALTGARGVLTDPEESELTGIGAQAVLLSGTFSGMSSQVTTGLADLGGFAVLVQVLGGDTSTHADLAESVLGLAAESLG